MNARLLLALGAVTIGFGVGCGTARTELSARPVGLDPDESRIGRSEASAARFSAHSTSSQDARFTRASSVSGCKPPTRAFPKWNPIWWFGNVDDPEPPAWYRPGSASRGWLWQLRNPFHNFTFYVIGIADKPFTRTGRFSKAVFAPDGGWNWAVARYGWLRLPFVSFSGEWGRCYFGWRERGNFGFKINCGKLPAAEPKFETPDPIAK